MKSDHPVEADDLIFSERASQDERHFRTDLSFVQSMSHRLEVLRHFHGLLGHALLVTLLVFGSLFLDLAGLTLRFGRPTGEHATGNFFLWLKHVDIILVDLTLFDELFCLERLGHFHAEFQMLGHEVFELLRSHLLALLLVLDVVVVAQYFLARLPVKLNDI